MSNTQPAPNMSRRGRARVTARGVLFYEGRVLFLKGVEQDGREWFVIPGGGVEVGETLEEALIREMREETGIHVRIERPLFVREFIAARHPGRSYAMPDTHHALAVLYLCSLCDQAYKSLPALNELGDFPGDVDGSGAIVGMQWLKLEEIAEHDVRPPQLRHAFGQGIPEGFTLWAEENSRSREA